jgi:hypothetical protein
MSKSNIECVYNVVDHFNHNTHNTHNNQTICENCIVYAGPVVDDFCEQNFYHDTCNLCGLTNCNICLRCGKIICSECDMWEKNI